MKNDNLNLTNTLYYSWFNARLNTIIVKQVLKKHQVKNIMDIDCGAGVQSYLYALAGASVIGSDYKLEIINACRDKEINFSPEKGLALSTSSHFFTGRYNKALAKRLEITAEKMDTFKKPLFIIADTNHIPFRDASFDLINATSSLSYQDNIIETFSEYGRLLRDDGLILCRVETTPFLKTIARKLISLVKRNKYRRNEERLKQDLKTLITTASKSKKHSAYKNDYEEIFENKKYYTYDVLKKCLKKAGFKPLKKWPLFTFTGIIPESRLKQTRIGLPVKILFIILSVLEELLPIFGSGNSIIVLARKVETIKTTEPEVMDTDTNSTIAQTH